MTAPKPNEVWQEADGCCLVWDGREWLGFGAPAVPERMQHPLRRLLDQRGALAPEAISESVLADLEKLRAVLRDGVADVEHKRGLFAAPYSSHEAKDAYHEARGFVRGIARAMETLFPEEVINATRETT